MKRTECRPRENVIKNKKSLGRKGKEQIQNKNKDNKYNDSNKNNISHERN